MVGLPIFIRGAGMDYDGDEILERWVSDRDRGDDAFYRLAYDINQAELIEDIEEKVELLTPRQKDVLQAASVGLTAKMMADVYGLSFNSITTHLVHAKKKLHAKNMTHAVAIALRAGKIN